MGAIICMLPMSAGTKQEHGISSRVNSMTVQKYFGRLSRYVTRICFPQKENSFHSIIFPFSVRFPRESRLAKLTVNHRSVLGHIMESISRLRTILLTALGSRGAQHGEQELFDELMVHQQCLLKLFDVGPRNPQEQREIESGAYYSLPKCNQR